MRTIIATIVSLAALAACGPSFHHPTPKEFVELEDQRRYDYRAVSADGMVLAVRELEHEPEGDLAFWSKAIENQMRKRAGYALLSVKDVKTDSGLAGKQMRFGHDRSQKPHLYYLTVFVTDKHIYLLEAGGSKEQMTQRDQALATAIAGFRGK
jgi:hypothetical protein